uniref:Uncharacterized protein n=1 Tax=Picea sitchensis TaxID=3332 RepID=A9NYE2_PICSI|nr:unknown [Picea sitchensis]
MLRKGVEVTNVKGVEINGVRSSNEAETVWEDINSGFKRRRAFGRTLILGSRGGDHHHTVGYRDGQGRRYSFQNFHWSAWSGQHIPGI